jgi:hypothetical protein
VFGGATGPFRLLDTSLGDQAGWLLGFAVVGGVAVLAASRLRRADPRTGWLIAVGGAFLTTAVAFSYAHGIFHPYYVSALAPAVAALAGFGSLSYAASKASTGASSAVKMVKVSVGLKKSAPAAKAKPSANAAKAKRSATRRKCADDADRPSEVQYEEEDDNFNDPEECSKKGDD